MRKERVEKEKETIRLEKEKIEERDNKVIKKNIYKLSTVISLSRVQYSKIVKILDLQVWVMHHFCALMLKYTNIWHMEDRM